MASFAQPAGDGKTLANSKRLSRSRLAESSFRQKGLWILEPSLLRRAVKPARGSGARVVGAFALMIGMGSDLSPEQESAVDTGVFEARV